MPLFTVYADIERKGKKLKHHFKKVAVHTFEEIPVSLYFLQEEFRQASKNAFEQYKQVTTILEIFQHNAGKGVTRMTNYRTSKMRTGRQPQAAAQVTYNEKTDTATIPNIIFESPAFFERFKFELECQTGIKYILKEVVPDAFETMLHNPESVYNNLLMVKSHSYGNPPPASEAYGESEEMHHRFGDYGAIPRSSYGSHDEAIIERDRIERENRL
jgi:hypothetical protein